MSAVRLLSVQVGLPQDVIDEDGAWQTAFLKEPVDGPVQVRRLGLEGDGHADPQNHGGVDKRAFELWSLAASIVGKCSFCVASHYTLLKETGATVQELRDIGRIAAVVNAAAQVLVAERTDERSVDLAAA